MDGTNMSLFDGLPTIEEFAKANGRSVRQIYRYRDAGLVKFVTIAGKNRVDVAASKKLVEQVISGKPERRQVGRPRRTAA